MALDTFKSVPHLLEQEKLLQPTVATNVAIAVPTFAATQLATAVAVTVTGAKIGDVVTVVPTAALPANAAVVGASVTAADTVAVTFTNISAGAVTGASRNFNIYIQHRS